MNFIKNVNYEKHYELIFNIIFINLLFFFLFIISYIHDILDFLSVLLPPDN